MTGLGMMATGAAWLNYQHAKKNYEQIEERSVGIKTVIDRYQELLDEWQAKRDEKAYEEAMRWFHLDERTNDFPEGVSIGVILRIGNIVGTLMRAEPTVVISNTSSNQYYLQKVELLTLVMGYPISIKDGDDYMNINRYIKPGETMEIVFGKGLTTLVDADGNKHMDELRKAICEACGKKLITSCPKISLDNMEKNDIVLYWGNNENDTHRAQNEYGLDFDQYRTAYWVDYPGTLRYCGEAYL